MILIQNQWQGVMTNKILDTDVDRQEISVPSGLKQAGVTAAEAARGISEGMRALAQATTLAHTSPQEFVVAVDCTQDNKRRGPWYRRDKW